MVTDKTVSELSKSSHQIKVSERLGFLWIWVLFLYDILATTSPALPAVTALSHFFLLHSFALCTHSTFSSLHREAEHAANAQEQEAQTLTTTPASER